MKKTNKIIFWTSMGLLSAMMVMSAGMYFVQHDMVAAEFTKIGYPTYLIYPLAVLKLLGLVAIWTNKSATLREWAYAGFFFDFLIAASAHINIGDGEFGGALIAMVLLLVAYIFQKRALAQSTKTS